MNSYDIQSDPPSYKPSLDVAYIMCGIAGVVGRTIDEEMLKNLVSHQRHRGPDDTGYRLNGTTGLGHRRLSIIDPGSDAQPLSNEDDSIHVSFNGEIYNYQAIRRSLSNRHQFETDTDTEILLHLYEEKGPDFVKELDGMFAFALWDENKERIVLARDRSGIKPLHVLDANGEIAFASELRPLVDYGPDHGGIDTDAIATYLTLGYIPSPYTAFENVRKLQPAERAIIDGNNIQYDFYYDPKIPRTEDSFTEASRKLRHLLTNAVQKRLMSDVPLGAFLSGGIDSSIIVGVMAELMDEPVKTFTVGFDENQFDESWAAREVAEFHGTDHHEYVLSPNEVRETIPDVLPKLGEPFGDPSLIPTYIVSRETSNDVKVALSGDGGDELFAGYDKYRGEYLSRYYRSIPEPIRRRVVESGIQQFGAARERRVGELLWKAQEFTNVAGKSRPIDRHYGWLENTPHQSTVAANGEEAAMAHLQHQRTQSRGSMPADLANDDIALMQATDARFTLPDQILTKVDLASMYNSLEVRVPLLDRSVVEYAISLPTEYKITPRKQKRILKTAFSDILPQSILDRKKQSFDMPIGAWFKQELHDDFVSAVDTIERSLADTDDPYLDVDAVRAAFESHTSGETENSRFLWMVYVLGNWLEGVDH